MATQPLTSQRKPPASEVMPPNSHPPSPAAIALAPTPLSLLQIAVSQNADIDKLSKLMDLHERWERNEARKGYVAAMNDFKQNPPAILKNKSVDQGPGKASYDHATLDQVCRAVVQELGKHGLSHSWRMRQPNPQIVEVTCVITHALGHCEETTLSGPPDQSGSKNSIQAIASTVTYLERYTLLAATGLAAANTDNDRRGAVHNASAIAPQRMQELSEGISQAGNREILRSLFKAAYVEAEQAGDKRAQQVFIQAYESRKRSVQS